MDRASLQKLKVYELKDICRQVKLRSSGKKSELIDRIDEYFAQPLKGKKQGKSRKRKSCSRPPLGSATSFYAHLSNIPEDSNSRLSVGSVHRRRILPTPPEKEAPKKKKKSIVPRTREDLAKTIQYLKIRLVTTKPSAWNSHESSRGCCRRALAKDRMFRAGAAESYVVFLRAAKMEAVETEGPGDVSDTLTEDSEEHQVMWDMHNSTYNVFGIGPAVLFDKFNSAAEANQRVFHLSIALLAAAFPRSKPEVYHRFCRESIVDGLSTIFVHPDIRQKRRSSRKCWQISVVSKQEFESSYGKASRAK